MKTTDCHISFLILFMVMPLTFYGRQKTDADLLKKDLIIVWPLVQTVKVEYDLATAQLQFYKTEKEKDAFLTKYETFVKDKYKSIFNVV